VKVGWLHQRPGWPDLSWDAAALAGLLARVRHRQGRLLGRMEALGFEVRTEANVVALTSEVIKSSAIEGEMLDADDVRSSVARRLGLPTGGLPAPRREVEGMVEMMLDATQDFAAPLSRDRLFGWHAALFPTGYAGIKRIATGAWRPAGSDPMQVVSGAVGRERVHFEAPSADRIEKEMAAFLGWFDAPPPIDPVLMAGVAHLWFVTVHPFEDGNGRIARAITDLALARADGAAERYYSMSTRIEAERRDYYLELEAAQRGDLDITRWLDWFLGCLERALEGADHTLASVLYKARLWRLVDRGPVNDRQRKVIARLLDGFRGFLTTSKYAKIAKCSADTALRDIRELLERRILVKNPGGGRSTSYRLVGGDEILEE
jgi:Fic family protein